VVTAASVIAQIQENITATDAILRRLLWEPIDDDEVVGWTDILRPQTIDNVMTFGGSFFGDIAFAADYTINLDPNPVFWTQINDDQVATWTQINDNTTAGWTDVDDTQTANWTEVVQ
jgi:hypothetical protein